jgi:hypothetical protein
MRIEWPQRYAYCLDDWGDRLPLLLTQCWFGPGTSCASRRISFGCIALNLPWASGLDFTPSCFPVSSLLPSSFQAYLESAMR